MVRSELWAEEIVSISDSVKGSTSMEEINAAKLMVNARQWPRCSGNNTRAREGMFSDKFGHEICVILRNSCKQAPAE